MSKHSYIHPSLLGLQPPITLGDYMIPFTSLKTIIVSVPKSIYLDYKPLHT